MGVFGTPTQELVSTGNVRRRRRPPHSLLRALQSCLGERFANTRGMALGRPLKELCNLPRRRQHALLSQTWVEYSKNQNYLFSHTLRSSFRIRGMASACFQCCHLCYAILLRRLKSSQV